jgi:hypothetical protein
MVNKARVNNSLCSASSSHKAMSSCLDLMVNLTFGALIK